MTVFFTLRNLIPECHYCGVRNATLPAEKPAEPGALNFRFLEIYHKKEERIFRRLRHPDREWIVYPRIVGQGRKKTPGCCVL